MEYEWPNAWNNKIKVKPNVLVTMNESGFNSPIKSFNSPVKKSTSPV